MKKANIILWITRIVIFAALISSMAFMLVPVRFKESLFDARIVQYIGLVVIALILAAYNIGKFYAKQLNTSFDLTDYLTRSLKISHKQNERIAIINTVIIFAIVLMVGFVLISRLG